MLHFVIFIVAITAAAGTSAAAQPTYRDSIVRIQTETDDGKTSGTGFVVASDGNHCEIWTAAHCVGGIGTSTTIVFPNKTERTGIVARRILNDKKDAAKIIAKTTGIQPKPVDVSSGTDWNDSRIFHSGYGQSLRLSVKEVADSPRLFLDRGTYFPSPEPGDSGGPIYNGNGKVKAVVIAKTLEPKTHSLLLSRPIQDWLELK